MYTMESYSHDAFDVTGIIAHIPDGIDSASRINDVWKQRSDDAVSQTIVWINHQSMHAVYYNYDSWWYDMLIGMMTDHDSIQTNDKLITLTIPAQNYRYMTIVWGFPDSISQSWDTINAMPINELPRIHGYDLEMYNEAYTECTIAVSV